MSPGTGERGNFSYCLMETVPAGEDEKVLEMGSGKGYTTMHMYLMPQKGTLNWLILQYVYILIINFIFMCIYIDGKFYIMYD